jgi:hypothetical protein
MDEFSFQLKGEPTNRENADAVCLEVRVLDRMRAGQTIDFDLGLPGSGTDDLVELTIPGLSAMGLRIPAPVRCLNLNLSEQLSEKLHTRSGVISRDRLASLSGAVRS